MAASALSTSVQRRYHPVIDSTNAEAKRLILSAAEDVHRLAIVAGKQTAGRGRRGREWVSPEGNLYYSLILKPALPAERVQELVFVAALAAADAIEAPGVTLKWPNDVLLNGKKVAGLLLESVHKGNSEPTVIVGIGINIAHAPEKAMYPATSLKAEGSAQTLAQIEERLANSLLKRYENWRNEGLAATLAAWSSKGPKPGEKIQFSVDGAPVSGIYEGLAENGALLLKVENGETKTFWIGDVISN